MGDFSVCLDCGAINCFTLFLRLQTATTVELECFAEREPDKFALLQQARTVALELRRQRGGLGLRAFYDKPGGAGRA